MVKGVEDLRTKLQASLDLEEQLRGSIAGYLFPQFVIDLPDGGGKRLTASYGAYDTISGVSTWKSAIKPGKDFKYFDPL
jgi:lysine 2,3-aminomutase